MEKKEMRYVGHLETPECLYSDIYKGYRFYVVSYGSHPCCYVEIPEGDMLFNIDMDDCNISCHGGVTFSEVARANRFGNENAAFMIGWDYGHYGDYVYYGPNVPVFMHNEKKYTTDIMIDDVFDVIEQIIELNKQASKI